ncbi:ubiquitin carboxyl-terminal hydrolase, partial [Toxoplasma gondii RUB]
ASPAETVEFWTVVWIFAIRCLSHVFPSPPLVLSFCRASSLASAPPLPVFFQCGVAALVRILSLILAATLPSSPSSSSSSSPSAFELCLRVACSPIEEAVGLATAKPGRTRVETTTKKSEADKSICSPVSSPHSDVEEAYVGLQLSTPAEQTDKALSLSPQIADESGLSAPISTSSPTASARSACLPPFSKRAPVSVARHFFTGCLSASLLRLVLEEDPSLFTSSCTRRGIQSVAALLLSATKAIQDAAADYTALSRFAGGDGQGGRREERRTGGEEKKGEKETSGRTAADQEAAARNDWGRDSLCSCEEAGVEAEKRDGLSLSQEALNFAQATEAFGVQLMKKLKERAARPRDRQRRTSSGSPPQSPAVEGGSLVLSASPCRKLRQSSSPSSPASSPRASSSRSSRSPSPRSRSSFCMSRMPEKATHLGCSAVVASQRTERDGQNRKAGAGGREDQGGGGGEGREEEEEGSRTPADLKSGGASSPCEAETGRGDRVSRKREDFSGSQSVAGSRTDEAARARAETETRLRGSGEGRRSVVQDRRREERASAPASEAKGSEAETEREAPGRTRPQDGGHAGKKTCEALLHEGTEGGTAVKGANAAREERGWETGDRGRTKSTSESGEERSEDEIETQERHEEAMNLGDRGERLTNQRRRAKHESKVEKRRNVSKKEGRDNHTEGGERMSRSGCERHTVCMNQRSEKSGTPFKFFGEETTEQRSSQISCPQMQSPLSAVSAPLSAVSAPFSAVSAPLSSPLPEPETGVDTGFDAARRLLFLQQRQEERRSRAAALVAERRASAAVETPAFPRLAALRRKRAGVSVGEETGPAARAVASLLLRRHCQQVSPGAKAAKTSSFRPASRNGERSTLFLSAASPPELSPSEALQRARREHGETRPGEVDLGTGVVPARTGSAEGSCRRWRGRREPPGETSDDSEATTSAGRGGEEVTEEAEMEMRQRMRRQRQRRLLRLVLRMELRDREREDAWAKIKRVVRSEAGAEEIRKLQQRIRSESSDSASPLSDASSEARESVETPEERNRLHNAHKRTLSSSDKRASAPGTNPFESAATRRPGSCLSLTSPSALSPAAVPPASLHQRTGLPAAPPLFSPDTSLSPSFSAARRTLDLPVPFTLQDSVSFDLYAPRRGRSARLHAAPRKPVGLRNLGNTCYLNSFLQALFLSDAFVANVFRFSGRAPSPTSRLSCSSSPPQDIPNPALLRELQILFAQMLLLSCSDACSSSSSPCADASSDSSGAPSASLSPAAVLRVLPAEYRAQEQQDVSEAAREIFQSLGGQEDALIRSVFAGQTAQVVECCFCQTQSRREEVIHDLGFPVPSQAWVEEKQRETARARRRLSKVGLNGVSTGFEAGVSQAVSSVPGGKNSGARGYGFAGEDRRGAADVWEGPSLQEFFDALVKKERLCGENAYACEVCKTKRDAVKWQEIVSPPAHLIVVLNRYSWSVFSNEKKKNATHVHVDGTLTIGVFTYELYAAVIHAGASANSGHYYCLGRRSEFPRNGAGDNKGESRRSAWFKFDDSRVTPVDEETVNEISADDRSDDSPYMLFYRCVQAPRTSTCLVPKRILKSAERRLQEED